MLLRSKNSVVDIWKLSLSFSSQRPADEQKVNFGGAAVVVVVETIQHKDGNTTILNFESKNFIVPSSRSSRTYQPDPASSVDFFCAQLLLTIKIFFFLVQKWSLAWKICFSGSFFSEPEKNSKSDKRKRFEEADSVALIGKVVQRMPTAKKKVT